jgi:antitoxin YefM
VTHPEAPHGSRNSNLWTPTLSHTIRTGAPQSYNYAIILYITTLPIADARAQLSKLVDAASSTHERFEITKNGHRAAVLMGVDDYDAILETIAVLSDSALLRVHEAGIQELANGDALGADQLAKTMKNAGRGVHTK